MKTFDGTILSTKMNKTAVVVVVRKRPHPLYKKVIKRNKKFKADTSEINVLVGDKVKIQEIRPISKEKHFKIVKVLESKGALEV